MTPILNTHITVKLYDCNAADPEDSRLDLKD